MKNNISKSILDIRDSVQKHRNLDSKYSFDNKLTGKENYLIILTGYKKYLYNIVFDRLKKYLPNDFDVCLITSGKYDLEIHNLAKSNNWSYLSTKKNKVAVAQNIAIKINDKAKYIFKMDEDIFLTDNCFQTLINTYKWIKENGNNDVGFIAPIMPLNGFGAFKILEEFNLNDYYSKHFEKPMLSSNPKSKLLSDPRVAEFFWGKDDKVDNIDVLNSHFQSKKFEFYLCPIRYSIGFILFEKDFWEEMGMFRSPVFGSGMGIDEEQICSYCVNSSKPMVVSGNTVVGHFSFGPQTKDMIIFLESGNMRYYTENL